MSSLVSICMPAYRAAGFLQATLDSVRSQNYSAWELIVAEDGSADGTEDMVDLFAKSVRQRVVYVRHDKNRGSPAARNTALSQATGEWVAPLDSDDLWKPSHLEDLVRLGSETNATVVASAATSFDSETGQLLYEVAQTKELVEQFPVSLYEGNLVILPSAAIVKRETLLSSGASSTRYPICNDTELWFRLAASGARFEFSLTSTCLYRKHQHSLSHQHAKALIELAKLYDEYAGWAAIPRSARRRKAASLYRYAGRTLLRENAKDARPLLAQALKRDWRSLSTWYLYARCFWTRRG